MTNEFDFDVRYEDYEEWLRQIEQASSSVLPAVRTMKNASPTISVQSFWKIWCGCTWKQSSAISSAMKITSVHLCRNA